VSSDSAAIFSSGTLWQRAASSAGFFLWGAAAEAGTIAGMPNIASILKAEISRVARKEIRAATESLKKQSTQYRSQIAALKRQVADLEKLLRKPSRGVRVARAAAAGEETAGTGLRFRSKGFAGHRQRLGLSAAQAGALLGVSGQTIYHWEAGKAKPRASQLPRIDALRKLSKKGAAAAVAQVMG
jgi:ribosome-binding protein aMBF1 (putative translation factor)